MQLPFCLLTSVQPRFSYLSTINAPATRQEPAASLHEEKNRYHFIEIDLFFSYNYSAYFTSIPFQKA